MPPCRMVHTHRLYPRMIPRTYRLRERTREAAGVERTVSRMIQVSRASRWGRRPSSRSRAAPALRRRQQMTKKKPSSHPCTSQRELAPLLRPRVWVGRSPANRIDAAAMRQRRPRSTRAGVVVELEEAVAAPIPPRRSHRRRVDPLAPAASDAKQTGRHRKSRQAARTR